LSIGSVFIMEKAYVSGSRMSRGKYMKEITGDQVLQEGLRVLLVKARAMNPGFRWQDWFDSSSIVLAGSRQESSQEQQSDSEHPQ
jgi:hypothetical protein